MVTGATYKRKFGNKLTLNYYIFCSGIIAIEMALGVICTVVRQHLDDTAQKAGP